MPDFKCTESVFKLPELFGADIRKAYLIRPAVLFNYRVQLAKNMLFEDHTADSFSVGTIHSSCLVGGTLQPVIFYRLSLVVVYVTLHRTSAAGTFYLAGQGRELLRTLTYPCMTV